MASVTPVEATDLNGIQISPMDIVSDELIGYCSYVKNLCSDLGTKNDSPEGYKSFLDFQKQIQAAKISTFEPEDIQTTDNFQSLDLTGENAEISIISEFLPEEVKPEQIEAEVLNCGIELVKSNMSSIIRIIKGKYPAADGKVISQIVSNYVIS